MNIDQFFRLNADKQVLMRTRISLAELIPQDKQNLLTKLAIKLGDKILGLQEMQDFYDDQDLQGLTRERFVEKALASLQITVELDEQLLAQIPKKGPLLIACNHPFGGIEGIVLAYLIGKVRPDLKVLANSALRVFTELNDYFIFTNPMSPRDPKNAPSLKQCLKHLKEDKALLIFPAGKISYLDRATDRTVEFEWNRLIGKILQMPEIQYVPLFIEGRNSAFFYRVERIFFAFRAILLGREMMNKRGMNMQINIGNTVTSSRLSTKSDATELAALARAKSYAIERQWRSDWPPTNPMEFAPLAEKISAEAISAELCALPEDQYLAGYRHLSVYYGYDDQIPNIVLEIARLRELVYRDHDEGSGEARDTDRFDAIYTHIFIVNNETNEIVGAYRMGQTDLLLKNTRAVTMTLALSICRRSITFLPTLLTGTSLALKWGDLF